MVHFSLFSSASEVTTGTTIEQDGKQLSTGEHSQKYPLEVCEQELQLSHSHTLVPCYRRWPLHRVGGRGWQGPQGVAQRRRSR